MKYIYMFGLSLFLVALMSVAGWIMMKLIDIVS
ncbi:uncharacterized protein METZ01_LOCUS470327 [marine metagenome]|uniref:Uncharacterized protein n=1 Tax=marine metagenome TaxID=408172 RepID=A0A383BCC7_9ZZZZ